MYTLRYLLNQIAGNMNRELRKRLSVQSIVDSEGNINHSYFRAVPGAFWSEEDERKLIQAIGEVGVGDLEYIKDNYFPHKSLIELELRTCILLGSHDLTPYQDFKDISSIPQEKSKNLKQAKKEGKLFNGIYLNKD